MNTDTLKKRDTDTDTNTRTNTQIHKHCTSETTICPHTSAVSYLVDFKPFVLFHSSMTTCQEGLCEGSIVRNRPEGRSVISEKVGDVDRVKLKLLAQFT